MKLGISAILLILPALFSPRDTHGQNVTVVRADNAPLWGTNGRFVREMRIGAVEAADEYMFGSVSSMAVAPDGNIFVLDRAKYDVREYDARGRYVRTFGRRGAGPGEIGGGGSIVIVRDHVVVLDAANGRLTIFPRAGGEPKHHPVGYAGLMFGDTLGRVVLPLRSTEGQRLRALRFDILRMQADTLTLPWLPVPGGTVEVVKQQGSTFQSAVTTVPYSREVVWTYSRFGEILGGNNGRYTLDRMLPNDRVMRIVRNTPGASVSADERRYRIENMEKAIRPLDENYRYNGPRLSSTKPLFTQVSADHDGRIWLTRPLASVRERNPETKEWEWIERYAYDVIDRDGRFLGTLALPPSFRLYHASGNAIWGVERDGLGVQYVARYRIER